MTPSRRLLYGCLTAMTLLLFIEGALWGVGVATGRELRVDPLPAPADHAVLCAASDGQAVRLCPDRGPAYERVRPLEFALRPSRPRVVTVGESFVYGLGLEAAEAWPAQLEQALGGEAEVLNLGRCGTYASRLQPQVAAAGTLQADVVIISVGNNEHTMTSFFTGTLGRHPLPQPVRAQQLRVGTAREVVDFEGEQLQRVELLIREEAAHVALVGRPVDDLDLPGAAEEEGGVSHHVLER